MIRRCESQVANHRCESQTRVEAPSRRPDSQVQHNKKVKEFPSCHLNSFLSSTFLLPTSLSSTPFLPGVSLSSTASLLSTAHLSSTAYLFYGISLIYGTSLRRPFAEPNQGPSLSGYIS